MGSDIVQLLRNWMTRNWHRDPAIGKKEHVYMAFILNLGCCNYVVCIYIYIPAVTKGCRTWRLGVPSYSTHLGTKHHPVLCPLVHKFFGPGDSRRTTKHFPSTEVWFSHPPPLCAESFAIHVKAPGSSAASKPWIECSVFGCLLVGTGKEKEVLP